MDRLLELCHKERIVLQYVPLCTTDRKLLGLYVCGPDVYTILLDVSLKNNYRKHREVLAEELGHHFMGINRNFFVLDGFHEYTIVRRDENRALQWATDFLIPDKELVYAVSKHSLRSCFELAEYFDVTQSFMWAKLGFIRSCYRKLGLRIKSRDIFNMKMVPCAGV